MAQSHVPDFCLRQRFRACNICRATYNFSLKSIQALFLHASQDFLRPFMTFKILFSPWKTYPFLSNSPRESKFLFKSGTYLTSVNNLIDSSWSLNLTNPTPAILQALLFPSNTDPPS